MSGTWSTKSKATESRIQMPLLSNWLVYHTEVDRCILNGNSS